MPAPDGKLTTAEQRQGTEGYFANDNGNDYGTKIRSKLLGALGMSDETSASEPGSKPSPRRGLSEKIYESSDN